MDKHFLDFRGTLLVSTARGQKQMEALTRWLNQGFTGVDSLMAPFRKFYGLDQVSPPRRSARKSGTSSQKISKTHFRNT